MIVVNVFVVTVILDCLVRIAMLDIERVEMNVRKGQNYAQQHHAIKMVIVNLLLVPSFVLAKLGSVVNVAKNVQKIIMELKTIARKRKTVNHVQLNEEIVCSTLESANVTLNSLDRNVKHVLMVTKG